MRNLLLAAAMAPLCLLIANAPAGDDDILVKLTDKATEIYAGKGFSRSGWNNGGELKQGETKRFSLTLSDGAEFSVVGMCDTSCGDLNLVLNRFSGEEEASDLLDDDFPIINTKRAGMYSVTVTMVKCTGTCRYALVGFKK